MRAIDSVLPIKKVRGKANSKPWFDSEIILAIQKRDKPIFNILKAGLQTDKNSKPQKYFFKRCYTERKGLI